MFNLQNSYRSRLGKLDHIENNKNVNNKYDLNTSAQVLCTNVQYVCLKKTFDHEVVSLVVTG